MSAEPRSAAALTDRASLAHWLTLASPWGQRPETSTLDALESRFKRPRFRLSPRRYPVGTVFDAATREGVMFVIEGCCRVTAGGVCVLTAGDAWAHGAGVYRFEVPGPRDVHIASVWDLEAIMRSHGGAP